MIMADYKDIYYTICPVANSTYLSVHTGILKEHLNRIGYEPVRLQTLPIENWGAHFTYDNDRLFREGGNEPPLWAKSRGQDVVLIGVNISEMRQRILVRPDYERPEQYCRCRRGFSSVGMLPRQSDGTGAQ